MRSNPTLGKSKYLGKTTIHMRGKIKVMEMIKSRIDGSNNFLIKVIDHRHDKYKKGETFIFSANSVGRLFKEEDHEKL